MKKNFLQKAILFVACVGAAILAGVGGGVYNGVHEGLERLSVGEETILPDAASAAEYAGCFSEYKRRARLFGEMYEGVDG